MDYEPGDLVIIDDPIKVIQRNPTLYGGASPRGARLAAALARDLIEQGDLPVTVDRVAGWWFITCEKDWLAAAGEDEAAHWFRMIPNPASGPEAIRPEILLTAFASGLFTAGPARTLHWIVKGIEMPPRLTSRVRRLLASNFGGRAVGFTADPA